MLIRFRLIVQLDAFQTFCRQCKNICLETTIKYVYNHKTLYCYINIHFMRPSYLYGDIINIFNIFLFCSGSGFYLGFICVFFFYMQSNSIYIRRIYDQGGMRYLYVVQLSIPKTNLVTGLQRRTNETYKLKLGNGHFRILRIFNVINISLHTLLEIKKKITLQD